MWRVRWHFTVIALIVGVLVYYAHDASFVQRLLRGSAAPRSEQPTADEQLWPPNPQGPRPPSPSLLHTYAEAAVCTDNKRCSEIGTHILQRNGSAVDATIAAMLCNGLVTMQSMGLGGGMLMTVYVEREQRAYSVLAREVAPLNVRPVHEADDKSALFQSSLAIAVPTEVAGYAAAHERFGRLPWAELVRPTVWLCHSGYPLSLHQLDSLNRNASLVRQDALLRRMFVDEASGEFWPVGTLIRPPQQLCRTYELLAEEGALSFYRNGTIAARLAADLRDLHSSVDARDLRRVRVQVVPAVVAHFGADYHIHLPPPPGSGHILALLAHMLQRFEPDFRQAQSLDTPHVHRITEALKFAFVRRWQLDVQATQQLLFNLTCPTYAARLAAAIDDARTLPDATHYGADPHLLSRPDHGTAHISLLAPSGDAVSATSSIHYYFGSSRMGARTGVLFNNVIADFAIDGVANYFAMPHYGRSNELHPGQSPMSSMCPLIVSEKGRVRLVTGAAGGTKIISVLTQLLIRMLWLGQDIKQAIDAPRFHHQLLPDMFEYEYGLPQPIVDGLAAKGHRTHRYGERGSAVCGIERRSRFLHANADYRKEGSVDGF